MIAPDETQLPSDVEPDVEAAPDPAPGPGRVTYPTHDQAGQQVLAYDSGIGRPTSAPLRSERGTGAPPPGYLPDRELPMLALPRNAHPTMLMALAGIVAERARQDTQWGGPPHDDGHAPVDWLNFIDDHLARAAAKGPDDLDGLIDKLTDVAALACAAIESLMRRRDKVDSRIAARLAENQKG